ncbi:unnamed protein product [Acanthoscelides obtectus]|uniref:Uncharacterized protein n=1 Tax=Acanthoscelides obtectus TaxID=200917 RepID=A0A9P0JJY6_ACAOB|nr:unnamed protein product [Acanthoscelides obtectus]CAK1678727.1 hypothetical protein AOBTE_LOCUS32011 [Acanthoscelides obtectus]
MGQRHSSSPKSKRHSNSSYRHRCTNQEITEVVEISESDARFSIPNDLPKTPSRDYSRYPRQIAIVNTKLDELEDKIINMTESQINLYFPTFKDELHSCWQKVYGVKSSDGFLKQVKIEVIERIKMLLGRLNARHFRKKTFFEILAAESDRSLRRFDRL